MGTGEEEGRGLTKGEPEGEGVTKREGKGQRLTLCLCGKRRWSEGQGASRKDVPRKEEKRIYEYLS